MSDKGVRTGKDPPLRASMARPTGRERLFGADEIIVSKTDPKGIITYANEVFLRVSVYDEADVVGRPHNLIRHPDMPRAIFALMWDVLASGREIFAFVQNLASDGEHYWVLAHVTPTFGPGGAIIGYHSNRRLPDRAAVAKVAATYADLRAVERRHSAPREALAASTARLTEILAAAGLTYDEYFWSLVPELTTPIRNTAIHDTAIHDTAMAGTR
jgi:PAS domain S-box-containing protein